MEKKRLEKFTNNCVFVLVFCRMFCYNKKKCLEEIEVKILSVAFCTVLLVSMLTGCRAEPPQTTTNAPSVTLPTGGTTLPGTSGTDSAGILTSIWDLYGENERFAVYGGTVEHAVNDAPGDLDLGNTEELTSKYLLPQAQIDNVSDGASLVHMMNNNIFTAAVFRLTSGAEGQTFAKAWRDAIHQNRWICGQPEKLLMLSIDESHILMAFGSGDAMAQFEGKAMTAFPNSKTLYSEAIVG